MRIVMLASAARSLVNFRGPLVRALCLAGCEVHAVAPGLSKHAAARDQLESWGVIIHDIAMQRTGMNPIKDLKTLFAFYRLLKRIKPDAVLGYTIKPVVYGTIASRLARVPERYALITGLGYAFTGNPRGKRALVLKIVREMYRRALEGAKMVFFQNPDDEALFRELKLIKDSAPSMVINGSGIDTTDFSVVPLPGQPLRFLLIARLLGDKGVREYVSAAEKVRIRYPDIVFRLVGNIDANPDSIDQAELDKWIQDGHIEYLGKLDDVKPAIADASVYVLPSYREGTPRTVLEAMAMGRAIITTDAPGCRETVVPGLNGYLVPVRSVDALVEAMEKLILQPDLAKKMGARSREIAVAKYDVHKVNDSMLKAMNLTA